MFAGGFGLREQQDLKPDADTLYMIASNTKAMTTLMLAKLVDEGKLTWETPVAKVLPAFKLGNADTTSRVLIKHLICACSAFRARTSNGSCNTTASPDDGARDARHDAADHQVWRDVSVFEPARRAGGSSAVTSRIRSAAGDGIRRSHGVPGIRSSRDEGDHLRLQASARGESRLAALAGRGRQAGARRDGNQLRHHPRAAGRRRLEQRRMLKYVQMEARWRMLPGGRRYIARDTLLARRDKQVPLGQDAFYGMGLVVDSTYGTPVVHHGGDMIGYHSDMIWLPEHNVGAVILTNGDPGWALRGPFQRKLLEVLFDGRPQADADVPAQAKASSIGLPRIGSCSWCPAAASDVTKLATRP